MKKIILGALMALSMFSVSAQVMNNNGVRNTLWAGFGSPDTDDKNITFYGFTDTLQARVDIGMFTLEGMINWGLFTDFDCNGSRSFEYTQKTAFYAANRCSDFCSTSITDSLTDKYYVNFLWHPFKGFDVGAGSRLDWKVGPAPVCGDFYWGKDAHIKEGGLKDAFPGNTDVAGFVYYPNIYAKEALGVRYTFDNLFQIGFVIPSGATTGGFTFNVGARLQPMDLFAVSFAYEGACATQGNLYAGLELYPSKNITINGYYAMDNVGNNYYGGVNGFGLSAIFGVKGTGLSIAPEFGMTFYENQDYSNAMYFGSNFDFALTKQINLSCWLSFAFGAEHKYWKESNAVIRAEHGLNALTYAITRDWQGGNVFDIRPKIDITLNSNNNIAFYADYQQRTTYNNNSYGCWAGGMYWTYTK